MSEDADTKIVKLIEDALAEQHHVWVYINGVDPKPIGSIWVDGPLAVMSNGPGTRIVVRMSEIIGFLHHP